jgi:Tol biopolymer transport system component/flagellar hook assembly protein FlgD/fibronectin type 3 domain-containing protein
MRTSSGRSILAAILLLLCVPLLSFGETFTATSLNDFGNVTVMEVSGNYDAKNPDGTINANARRAIAREFYRLHKDEYDFLVIFTNFSYQMPQPEMVAFYSQVKNDTQGIGLQTFDYSASYGSNGRLQGTIDMGDIARLAVDPVEPRFEFTLDTISHEMMHRWAAYLKFKNPDGTLNTGLLGRDNAHWSYLLDTDASLMYGNTWQDNGDGTFTSVKARKYYSQLDLYLMGFIDKSEVPPMLLIENPDIDPARVSEVGVTISGSPRYVTIDEIVAAEGDRIPGPAQAQRSFTTAFIYVTAPGTFSPDDLYGLENIRNGWITRYSVLTDGAGILQVAPIPHGNLPAPPGVSPPPDNPRTLPPDIEDGVRWLMNNQKPDGSWVDLGQTAERDTAETLAVLKDFTAAQANWTSGLQWLNNANSENTDYRARKISALLKAGQDATALIGELVARQNQDGGWGSGKAYMSNATDTARVLRSLAEAGGSAQSAVEKAVAYLKTRQNSDGGWGNDDGESRIEQTADVLNAFNTPQLQSGGYQMQDRISGAKTWLISRQNTDGGFGNSPSTIYDTAIALVALTGTDVSDDTKNRALHYLTRRQAGDGSWQESPYQTALAVGAVLRRTIDPDLAIRSSDITFEPATVRTLPATISISAKISNMGRTDAQAKVVLYENAPLEANRIAEQTVLFPGGQTVTVIFPVEVRDGNEHRYYVSADPDNLVRESDETNNIAAKILSPEPTYDFEVNSSDITLSANPADMYQDVKVTARIRNKGTMNAYNVQVRYFTDAAGGAVDIGTKTVDIPANATLTDEIIWKADRSGVNMPVTVVVDPFDNFPELSEINNRASTFLTVRADTRPNIAVSYKDIVFTPVPANEGGAVTISALIRNEGFASADNVAVDFYRGIPCSNTAVTGQQREGCADALHIGTMQMINSLAPGESRRVSTVWSSIPDSGDQLIYVQAYGSGNISEIIDTDNYAFTTLSIMSLPDLAVSANSIIFSPEYPKDGDVVTISALVQNKGQQAAYNVVVRASEGGLAIGEQVIGSIPGNSEASVVFSYPMAGGTGIRVVTIVVDPDNTVIERTKDNNRAAKQFGVQDADLWLSEQFISPNGDGLKDETWFYFKLPVQQTVKVVVANAKNEAIRTFSGGGLANVSEGSIVWDGRNDDGLIVPDGEYWMQVRTANESVIGTLQVVVDTNRSSLLEALNRKALLNNNLTCLLPDIWGATWFPDESGMLVEIGFTDPNTPEYTPGIFSASADGMDVLRLVPEAWSEYSFYGVRISPDGERVAFSLYDWQYSRMDKGLWIVDKDGLNLEMLVPGNGTANTHIDAISWSPDGRYMVYTRNSSELWVLDLTDRSTRQIDSFSSGTLLGWSPDATRLAYEVRNGWNRQIRSTDMAGNIVDIFLGASFHYLPSVDWLNGNRIIIKDEYSEDDVRTHHVLWLADAGGGGNHIRLADYFADYGIEPSYSVSPDRHSVAFWSGGGLGVRLNVADANGTTTVLLEDAKPQPGCWPALGNLLWSPDSARIGFSGNCKNGIVNRTDGSVQAIPGANVSMLNAWLSDGESIIASGDGIYLVDARSSGTLKIAEAGEWLSLSPGERYVTYTDFADPSSVCYGKGQTDLWAMSSLLNLTADLRVVRKKSGVVLKGIAMDLNFEGYRLEYADRTNPEVWHLVAPPSDMQVVNGEFAEWVPPYMGTFYVRLTVWDKAGNTAWDRKRVSWGTNTKIANIQKTRTLFSPNNDGVLDTVELYYTVLEPAHLEFGIYDEKDALVRTITKDYLSAGTGSVEWDGRDDGGNVVPDGKYVIRVLDYEFSVEVDNTPPDLKGVLGQIEFSLNDKRLHVFLMGHAYDRNLKHWVLEYGEGDNPAEWYKYDEGSGVLAMQDAGGGVFIPIRDVVLDNFQDDEISWLGNKKFRLSAEDYAGNTGSVVTGMVDERLFVTGWDSNKMALGPDPADLIAGYVPGGKGAPGLHILSGIETLRHHPVSLMIVYETDAGLIEVPAAEYSISGILAATIDTSIGQNVKAVRVKGIDIEGREFYSNKVVTREFITIGRCATPPVVSMSFAERLTQLKMSYAVQGDTVWKDFYVLDADAGDIVPQDTVAVPVDLLPAGQQYMVAITLRTESGNVRKFDAFSYPPSADDCHPCSGRIDVKPSVSYQKASACGQPSTRATLSAAFKLEGDLTDLTLRELSYYLQGQQGMELIRSFSIPKDGLGTVDINTSNLAEGLHPIQVVLTYDVCGQAKPPLSASGMLLVDRALPVAQIGYPVQGSAICPVKVTTLSGTRYEVPVEGVAGDNNQESRYTVFYGLGDSPGRWLATKLYGDSRSGQLGSWNITDLRNEGPDFSLRLEVTDKVGNLSCATTSFSVDTQIEIAALNKDPGLISPNGDGVSDDTNVSYTINENATVDIKVFPLTTNEDGLPIPGPVAIRTLITGMMHSSGTEAVLWDGKGDLGGAVPDGKYAVVVYATDSCGNTASKWTAVEVDNTKPVAAITFPVLGDTFGNLVEVRGISTDLHFLSYALEAGQGDNPQSWTPVTIGTAQVQGGILGEWNTTDLTGRWTLRLTAVDQAGNSVTVLSPVDVVKTVNLLKNISAAPSVFSPNGDGRLDTTLIRYELAAPADTTIEFLDASGYIKKTVTVAGLTAGQHSFTWTGKDNTETVVLPDGAYTIKITASQTGNTTLLQTEKVTVVIDTTAPEITISYPPNAAYIKDAVTIRGTIRDQHLSEYSVRYAGSGTSGLIDQAVQPRENHDFGVLNNLLEGDYILTAKAKDLGENQTEKVSAFTIDRTPPVVKLDTPGNNEFYGSNKNVVTVNGSIVEKNLESFTLRYGAGAVPSVWTGLMTGYAVPTNPQLFLWKVGKNDGIPDGTYTLSLLAKDKAGSSGEAKVKITVDNEPPVAAITLPGENSYVTRPIDILGTAFDLNSDRYTVEVSEGRCSTASRWAMLMSGAVSVRDGILARWEALPPDGDYCLKLRVIDKAGNLSEAVVNARVDTHPPAAPVLSGTVEKKKDARMTWIRNSEPDLAGYNVYRGSQKLNSDILTALEYLDCDVAEGDYIYTLRAVDLAGWESQPSNEVRLRIDRTGPSVRIRYPLDGALVSDVVDIKGAAHSDDFKQYRVSVGQGASPSSWGLIGSSTVATSYGVLTRWDTAGIAGGQIYSIRLEGEDLLGNISEHQITVTIDNTPPVAPVLISAVPNNSDVFLTWKANTEPDLAGYLLYRNEQLANVTGIVSGPLKPYLMTGTTYLDKAVPDGKFSYYLLAMDKAGNLSDQSNTLEVTIDTHPPHTVIIDPLDNSTFGNKIQVKAFSPDLDIASVQFMYNKAGESSWTNLGSPVSKQPYVVFLDPLSLGLVHGNYHLRAVATDLAGQTDPAPAFITVAYTDVTAPTGLKTFTNAKTVTLTWNAGTGTDINGYNIYRAASGWKQVINSMLKDVSYQDTDLSDGTYLYEVTAIDTSGNESTPSSSALAKVYAPVISQPYTPTGQKTLQINGSNATPDSSVQIIVDTGQGPVSQGRGPADAGGNFTLDAGLALGENRISGQATDSSGNISRISDAVVVVYNEPPAAPTGLASSVSDYSVTLTWNPNSESDLSGYNLYRDGQKRNAGSSVTSGSATSSTYYNDPSSAFDADPSTSWISYANDPSYPSWWEIDLASTELINRIEIHWGSAPDLQGKETLYAGKDFEIQVWSGYAWITQEKVTGNTAKDNTFDFIPSYRTDRIRIFITDTTDPDVNAKLVMVSEVNLVRDNLISAVSYIDDNLHDGTYSYKVTAVDYYGFESSSSDEAKTPIGDVMPPAAPQNLTASVSGPNITLNWASNTEPDLAGYNIYRNTPQGWIKINTSESLSNAYTDSGLRNGMYSYRVTAVDTTGNESLPSNEALATVYIPGNGSDVKPVLFFPTRSGMPVVKFDNRSDVAGFAIPGSAVELFRNGVSVGNTRALENDFVRSYSIQDVAWDAASLSPDGKTLVYADNANALWLRNLASGVTKQMTVSGYDPVWSPDGAKIAFGYDEDRDNNLNHLIGLYEVRTGAVTSLMEQSSVSFIDENSPSWSLDGSSLSFISNRGGAYDVWIKDFSSGTVLPVTNGMNVSDPNLSPDGTKVAYIDLGENRDHKYLYVKELPDGENTLVDDNLDDHRVDWSPDSRRILFTSHPNGKSDVFSYDTSSHSKLQITDTVNYEYHAVWSPDGNWIAYEERDATTAVNALWIQPTGMSRAGRVLRQGYSLDLLSWARGGAVGYVDKGTLFLALPEGYFSLPDVMLESGGNTFYALSADSAGNTGGPSDSITVYYDDSQLPDLVITENDIYLYPPVPIDGQEVAMNIVVRNIGKSAALNVEAEVYVMDSAGTMKLLKTETFPSVSAESGEVIGVSWDSSGKTGINSVVVVLDPADIVLEQSETNNFVIKEFPVLGHEGLVMTTSVSPDHPTAGQDVAINVAIANSGAERSGNLEILIEDTNGYVVASFDAIRLLLPYGATEKREAVWNTGATLAGLYRVHTALYDAANIIAENVVPFEIAPEITVEASLVTDKAGYGPNENVLLSLVIKNNGQNHIISSLKTSISVADSTNATLLTEDKYFNNLLPGGTAENSSTWNTGLNAPGNYSGSARIYLNDQLIVSKSVSFKINPVVNITGSIQVTPSPVIFGRTWQVVYALQNKGNIDISALDIKVLIIDPDTQAVLKTSEEVSDIAMNGNHTGQLVFQTRGYSLKTYTALLQYIYQGTPKTPAGTSFTVKDGIPPTVSITSPVADNSYDGKVDIAATAVDDVSGVERVEYRIDSDVWRQLPVTDMSAGRYSTLWEPAPADNGNHIISFKGTDKAGNTGQPVSVNVTIRRNNVPPSGSITINDGAAYTKTDTVMLSLDATAAGGVAKMCVSNSTTCTAWEPYAGTRAWTLSSGDGNKTVYAWFEDSAGGTNTQPCSASIILDTTPPALAVSTLSDGSRTSNALLNVSGTATDGSGIQRLTIGGITVTVNSDGSFSYPVTLHDGPNDVSVSATDSAGNQTIDSRTIILDRTAPALSISSPADNIATKMSVVDVIGSVDEESAVTVRINASESVLAHMNGRDFSLTVTPVYGINTIEVTATDRAGNTSALKRTVIFDDQNPSLSVVDPAEDIRTSHANLVLRGETADLTAVTVSIRMDGNTYLPVVTAGTFEQPFTFTVEKPYEIFVRALDEAGNETTVKRTVIYDITAPTVAIDPVKSPTNRSSQVLSGTMEAGAAVSVTCPSATPGGVTYPTATSWTVSLSNLQEGDNTVTVTATDEAGNTSIPLSLALQLDTVPPVTTITAGIPKYEASGHLFVAGITVFSLSIADDLSGVARTEYRIDGGTWLNYSPFSIPGEGAHVVEYRSVDNAGNAEAVNSVNVVVDSLPPVLSTTVGVPNYQANGNLYIAAHTDVIISSADAGSGIRKVEYSVDGAPFVVYEAPIVLAPYSEGAHTIACRGVDNLGNTVSANTLTVILDRTAPGTTISASDPLAAGVVNVVSPGTAFSLGATDGLSGLKSIEYRIDSGEWKTYGANFSLSDLTAGTHAIAFRGVDNVFNRETEKAVTVRLFVIDVIKEISPDPVVLASAMPSDDDEGDHDDHAEERTKDRRRAIISKLIDFLSSTGVTYYVAKSRDEFKEAFRSGRFNVYLLRDALEDEQGLLEEIREAVNHGKGLIYMKAASSDNAVLEEVSGVKWMGKSNGRGLTVNLVRGPISDMGTLKTSGSEHVSRAGIAAGTAQALGYVVEREMTYPVIVSNNYGRGKVIFFGVDLPRSPERVKAEELFRNAVGYVVQNQDSHGALDSVPVRIRLTNAAEPVNLKITESIPPGTAADTISPQAIRSGSAFVWRKDLGAGEQTALRYHLTLPDSGGNYVTNTEVRYDNNGSYRLYGDYSLTVNVATGSSELLRVIINALNGIAPGNHEDAEKAQEALEHLHKIRPETSGRCRTEENISRILEAIEEIRKLSVDTRSLRLQLDELLKMWEKKWHQAGKMKAERRRQDECHDD